MNLKDLRQYGNSFDNLSWRFSPQLQIGNRRNDNSETLLPYTISTVDPFGHKVSIATSGNYGGYYLLYRVSMDVHHDEDHFWFRAVYQLINPKHVGYNNLNSMREWRRKFSSYVEEQLNNDNLGWGMLQSAHGARTGFVFATLEGGGPLDGAEIDVETIENIQSLANENYNQNAFVRGEHASCLSKGITCYLNPPSGEDNDVMTGKISIEPFGTVGLLEARVTSCSNKRKKHVPSKDFDNPALLEAIKRITSQKYKPYSGWIPSNTSDFEVDAGDFIMKQVAGEPSPLFGNDLHSRYRDRRIHMTGAVSLLYEGKKYNVPAGLYFVYPYDTNLEDVTMLQYDYWLTDLMGRITMLANSSRSQALTNRLKDQGDTPVVAAIQSRPISIKENGDSGFIPRPTKRRIN